MRLGWLDSVAKRYGQTPFRGLMVLCKYTQLKVPMLMNQPLPLFYLCTCVANAQGNQGFTKVDDNFLEYSVKRENLK